MLLQNLGFFKTSFKPWAQDPLNGNMHHLYSWFQLHLEITPGDVDAGEGEAWKIDWTKFGWTIIESLRNMILHMEQI